MGTPNQMNLPALPSQYQKGQSFEFTYSNSPKGTIDRQKNRAILTLKNIPAHLSDNRISVLIAAQKNLVMPSVDSPKFKITQFIADEMETIDDKRLLDYLFHRYRYDVYPKEKKCDDSPPLVQIEPTSYCNYRCVFCYQSDSYFHKKTDPHMGTMSFERYRQIIDQIEGRVEFVTLASRGEPFLCKEIDKMLEYSSGKFLNLKINTNASVLNEKHAHAVLSGGAKTLVFSADAADEKLYAQLRVNGKLSRVLKNIEMFKNIKEKNYSKTKIITRVSGVFIDERQNIESMIDLWGSLVDQISFVKYNPWENVYQAEVNQIEAPCSDLWRRLHIWFDGSTNPCETDFRSTLAIGNADTDSINKLWQGQEYQTLRKRHLEGKRSKVEPCRRCVVV